MASTSSAAIPGDREMLPSNFPLLAPNNRTRVRSPRRPRSRPGRNNEDLKTIKSMGRKIEEYSWVPPNLTPDQVSATARLFETPV